jgi:GTP cyclohydrolase I
MSLDKRKCDPELGARVRQHLIELGLETPLNNDQVPISGTVGEYRAYTVKEKIDIIERNVKEILETLGMDLTDDSLIDTPTRVAKMYVSEIFYGLDAETFPKCTAIENKFNSDEMIVERNVNVQSSCEHHLITIDGYATVAYIPNKKVLGLSKLNRIVEYFAKRPQVQERLTMQIHAALCFILETDNVAVLVDAQHFCVKSRGVQDVNSRTVTSRISGAFKDDASTKAEFMSIARLGS